MEPQRWRNLGVEVRRPTPASVVTALILLFLLHQQQGVPDFVTASAALVVLDCVRIRRTSATVQALDVPQNGTSLSKRPQQRTRQRR